MHNLAPFNRHDCTLLVERLSKLGAHDTGVIQAAKVIVMQLELSALVDLTQAKRRTLHHARHAHTHRQAFYEGRFTATEVAVEGQDFATPNNLAKFTGKSFGVFDGIADECQLHTAVYYTRLARVDSNHKRYSLQ